MSKDKKTLPERRLELVGELEKAKANVYRIEGALAIIDELIKDK
jgi:hypothetical protein